MSSDQPFSAVPIESYPRVREAVEALFPVNESYVEYGAFLFYIAPVSDTKDRFKQLVYSLKPMNLMPFLRWEGSRLVIKVLPKPPVKKSDVRINLALFAATFATVSISGYMMASNPLLGLARDLFSLLLQSFAFTLALLAIIGLHEFGHKLASDYHRISATPPYFIPAPPFPFGIGTFGAVISQKEPPVNRDELFDTGISGPIAGFVATILIAVIGLQLSPIVPETQVEVWKEQGLVREVGAPLLLQLLVAAMNLVPKGFRLLYHPIGFAAWIGCIITFLNLLPAWQLDGGHIVRACLGERWHQVATFLAIVVMFATGWFLMALLILLFAMGGGHPGALDDVSPLSWWRRAVAAVLVPAMLLLCFVPLSIS